MICGRQRNAICGGRQLTQNLRLRIGSCIICSAGGTGDLSSGIVNGAIHVIGGIILCLINLILRLRCSSRDRCRRHRRQAVTLYGPTRNRLSRRHWRRCVNIASRLLLHNTLIRRGACVKTIREAHCIGATPCTKTGNENDRCIPQKTFGRMLQYWKTHVQLAQL
jgi:hypothetical protein